MLQKCKAKLKDNQGGASGIELMLILLVVVLLISFTTQVVKPFILIQNVEQMTQKAVTDTAAANAYNVYGGVRESNTANVDYTDGGGWAAVNLNDNVMGHLQSLLKLQYSGGTYQQYSSNGQATFGLSNVTVRYTGVGKGGTNDVCLNFETTLKIHIPLRFGSEEPVVTITLPMYIKSRYLPLY